MASVADGSTNAALLHIERLVEAQRQQIAELQSNHAAIVDLLRSVRRSKGSAPSSDIVDDAPAKQAKFSGYAPSPAAKFARDVDEASSPSAASSKPAKNAGNAAVRTASAPIIAKPKAPMTGGNPQGESGAMKVVAAAHQRGLTLDDMGLLTDKEWQDLGATSEERQTILGALEARRRRVVGGRGNPQSGSPGSDAPRDLEQEEAFPPATPAKASACGFGRSPQGDAGAYDGPLFPVRNMQSEAVSDNRSVASQGPIAGERSPPKPGFDIGLGRGRQYIPAMDHIRGGSCIDGYGVPPVDQGRKHFAADKDHLYGGAADDCIPGAHGHIKDSALQGGLARGIGHGKHHIPVMDHIRGGTAVPDIAGMHGHSKDDDYEEGLQRGIGRGRRHLTSGMDAVVGAMRAAPISAPTAADQEQGAADGLGSIPAGLPSRYRTMSDPAIGYHRHHY